MSLIWQTVDYSFKLICVTAAIVMGFLGLRTFLLDEDVTSISVSPFYAEPFYYPYPPASVCFKSPYEAEKLNKEYNISSASEYIDFLSGEGDPWRDDLLKIDFENVSLNPMNYFLGYKINYRNTTEITKLYSQTDDSVHPSIRLVMPYMFCFGIDIQMTKEMDSIGIMINASVLENMNDSNSKGIPSSTNRELSIILHGQNQLLNSKWWKNDFEKQTKIFAITYDIRGVEMMRLRNKPSDKCNEDKNFDYDSEVFKEILDRAGCRPPYTSMRRDLELCKSQSKMMEIKENHFNHFSGLNFNHKPCNLL